MLKINFKVVSVSLLTCLLLFPLAHAEPENRTFNKVCHSCHTGGFKGFMSGAPNINEKKSWQAYLEKHSVDEMKVIVLQGSDEHKVKGGCKKCSDEEIIDAIEYILRHVSKAEDEK